MHTIRFFTAEIDLNYDMHIIHTYHEDRGKQAMILVDLSVNHLDERRAASLYTYLYNSRRVANNKHSSSL